MSSRPSSLRYHLMFTDEPPRGPERKWPSISAAVAQGSSSMSKTLAASHSPRCPAVIGRSMRAPISVARGEQARDPLDSRVDLPHEPSVQGGLNRLGARPRPLQRSHVACATEKVPPM